MSIDPVPVPGDTGALWLCGRADVGPDPEVALRTAGGASTIVCLNQPPELEGRYPEYVAWLKHHQGGRALWFPIRNFHAESADATMPFLRLVADRVEHGQGVLMHCAMGQGRAGTMAVCLLMMLGAEREDALRTVAGHRRFAGPADASQWALVDDVERACNAK